MGCLFLKGGLAPLRSVKERRREENRGFAVLSHPLPSFQLGVRQRGPGPPNLFVLRARVRAIPVLELRGTVRRTLVGTGKKRERRLSSYILRLHTIIR